MNIEEIRDYCLSKKGVTEGFPFDDKILVFKVMTKMFVLTNITGELKISLKCNPEKAIDLRELYSFVHPGYHLSKKHWNTIEVENSIDNKLLKLWIDDSYNLIVGSLTKKLQLELAQL